MLEYLDQLQAKRTGVSDLNQGLDANVLQNVSATAVATMTAQITRKVRINRKNICRHWNHWTNARHIPLTL